MNYISEQLEVISKGVENLRTEIKSINMVFFSEGDEEYSFVTNDKEEVEPIDFEVYSFVKNGFINRYGVMELKDCYLHLLGVGDNDDSIIISVDELNEVELISLANLML